MNFAVAQGLQRDGWQWLGPRRHAKDQPATKRHLSTSRRSD